jgi:hypothetical protein
MSKLLFLLFLFFNSLSVIAQRTTTPISLEEIQLLYDSLYVASEIDSMPWNGDTTTCTCGTLPPEVYEKVKKRVDFFRLTNRLPTVGISFRTNKMTQEAALISIANQEFTHYPSSKSKCFSELGRQGCRWSALGRHSQTKPLGINFITGFVMDYGKHNAAVGHRKWILHSRLDSVAYGATSNTEALWAKFTHYKLDDIPPFIAYPWSGCVPEEFIYPKWSISIPYNRTIDLGQATIKMWDEAGNHITVKIINKDPDRDATIVWVPTAIFPKKNEIYSENPIQKYRNQKIKVRVESIMIKDKSYSYEYFVQPVHLAK